MKLNFLLLLHLSLSVCMCDTFFLLKVSSGTWHQFTSAFQKETSYSMPKTTAPCPTSSNYWCKLKGQLSVHNARKTSFRGRCTVQLELKDTVVTSARKHRATSLHNRWVAITPRRLHRQAFAMVCTWVSHAWRSLPDDMVLLVFKKRSISDSPNCTTNGLLCGNQPDKSGHPTRRQTALMNNLAQNKCS